jgi:hypothetical protein
MSWKFRIAEIAPVFTAEVLTIDHVLKFFGTIDLKQNSIILSGFGRLLKGISDTSTKNNISLTNS